MKTTPRQIVAFGGGGFSMRMGNPLLDDYVLGLAAPERPRVCFLPSASGDADHYVVRFLTAPSRPIAARPATSLCSGASRGRPTCVATSSPRI